MQSCRVETVNGQPSAGTLSGNAKRSEQDAGESAGKSIKIRISLHFSRLARFRERAMNQFYSAVL